MPQKKIIKKIITGVTEILRQTQSW